MQSEEIRSRFLKFFEKRGHAVIPSASLVPENDSSVLFTTAGMQPLVPYLMGGEHPAGRRLVNVQKCVRTQDIDEVGDRTHDTFFEMLGNWSLGDPASPDGIGQGYFKEDAIKWSYELLTSKEEGFGLDKNRIYVTCFEGDSDAPKDEESAEIWRSLGIPESSIYFLGKDDNWWSPGPNGPCGPDTEMFYDIVGNLNITTKEDFIKANSEQKVVEIWNDVFMEYEKKEGKVIGKLKQKNVDTGAGLERLAMVLQGKNNIFDTDLFVPTIVEAERLTGDTVSQRIIADHFRTAVFIMADGVTPSNTDRGYILRRLLRRAIFKSRDKKINGESVSVLVNAVTDNYSSVYPELTNKGDGIKLEIEKEYAQFEKTIAQGLKEFERHKDGINGKIAFMLFTTYGFPYELTLELAQERNIHIDEREFESEMLRHQELSRVGAEKKFKGGLADTSQLSIKYHTATHMLHKALRDVLGDHVRQRGSNITPERLRFDFAHTGKMTDEEKKKVEDLINQKIREDLPVSYEEMETDKAFALGALGEFGAKYGDRVKVYSIGKGDMRFSYEICGGPHAERTGNMGRFRIIKEEAVAAGVRRIKAVLE